MSYAELFSKKFPSSTIGEDFDVAQAIYDAYRDGRIKPLTIHVRGTGERTPRTYIGASRIGQECERRVWLEFRGLAEEDFEGRMLRLFSRGDIGEERIRHELRCIGFEAAGDQSALSGFDGRFGGHTDGFVRLPGAPWLLLECKTASSKNFRRFLKVGLEKWKSIYWYQIHTYMAAFKIAQCLYVVVNKDTDEISVQLHDYDESVAKESYARARRVVTGDLPTRPFGAPKKPTCLWCPASQFCWEDQPLAKKCGSCRHWSSVDKNGGACGRDGRRVTQHDVCADYEALEQPDEDAVFVWGD